MVGDRAKCTPRFTVLHATVLPDADGSEPHDEFAAIAENVNVRTVTALVTGVNPDGESVDDPFGHDLSIPNLIRLIKKAAPSEAEKAAESA